MKRLFIHSFAKLTIFFRKNAPSFKYFRIFAKKYSYKYGIIRII